MSGTLAGTWKMESSEGFDDFLKEMGTICFIFNKMNFN